ncbi:C2 domain-containing protein [Dichotomocladium elegans]|nr:C2 domain-containing protein [Dichotomocladium elegans]
MLSTASAPAKGTLVVDLIEAKELHHEDTFGSNDVYAELWLDEDYKQKSEVLKNTSEPVFNQKFTFPIEEGSKHHKLHIKILDKDLAGSDKIGDAKIDFSSAYMNNVIDEWVKLPAKLGLSSHGEVHVRIAFNRD